MRMKGDCGKGRFENVDIFQHKFPVASARKRMPLGGLNPRHPRMNDLAAVCMSKRWDVRGRVVRAAVVAGNVVGKCGNVAAAVCFWRTAAFYSAASAAYAANDTAEGETFRNLGVQQDRHAESTQALQSFCEVAVLLLIIVAFAVVGAACAPRVSSALLDMADAFAAAGRQLRLQIVGTAVFVFVTFLPRSVFSTWHALAFELQDGDDAVSCPSNSKCDASSFNVYKPMEWWFICTPEFHLSVVLISSPIVLLVALWGMTSERTLRLMQSNRLQANTRDSMLRGVGAGGEVQERRV